MDDINWDVNPSKTFDGRNGPIKFADYYRDRYNVTIRNMGQPMLVSQLKDFQRRQADGKPAKKQVLLVPELCYMTGLSEDMKANYKLTADIAGLTRMPPDKRYQTLMAFSRRITQVPDSVQVLNDWGLSFKQDCCRRKRKIQRLQNSA